MRLPAVPPAGPGSLESTLTNRRSIRDFGDRPVHLASAAQLLWATQGAVDGGRRTVPSAGGVFPLTLTLVAGAVEGLDPGAYRYEPDTHRLSGKVAGDFRPPIEAAAIGAQPWLATAALIIVIGADVDAVVAHFADQPPRGERGRRYAYMEVGHAAQNAYLQATALGLGAVFVGGFDDDQLRAVRPPLLADGHQPLGLIAVGYAAASD
jgi:SagB-type dehydrogenase family enzyme